MNVPQMQFDQASAAAALRGYKAGRSAYDEIDKEIVRIFRAIARGKKVISAYEAIRSAGVDEAGRPRLAIMRADQERCQCEAWSQDKVTFTAVPHSRGRDLHFEVAWPNRARLSRGIDRRVARLPRIPPQYRPAATELGSYHLLWEASWTEMPPDDPYLLKRIGKDAWVVLAAWELTEVEMSVLRAHQ